MHLSSARLSCPACGMRLLHIHDSRSFKCPTCEADLVVGFKYNWLYVAICLGGGLIAARVQNLGEPVFVVCALIYSAILLILGARVLLPYFPQKVELARNHVQRLLS
jgi:hypothetical protein